MNNLRAFLLLMLAGLLGPAGSTWAQAPAPATPAQARATPAPAATTSPSPRLPVEASPDEPREPAVQHTVINENGVSVDEVHVRGEVRSIKVHPKTRIGLPDYEIVPSLRGHDPHTNAAGSRGAAGQRVWPVLSF